MATILAPNSLLPEPTHGNNKRTSKAMLLQAAYLALPTSQYLTRAFQACDLQLAETPIFRLILSLDWLFFHCYAAPVTAEHFALTSGTGNPQADSPAHHVAALLK